MTALAAVTAAVTVVAFGFDAATGVLLLLFLRFCRKQDEHMPPKAEEPKNPHPWRHGIAASAVDDDDAASAVAVEAS